MATVARVIGDLELAEDAVQDACAVALLQWPRQGVPANPRAWLVGTARHKAIDRLRRESRRNQLEAALDLESSEAERAFITRRLHQLG